MSDNLVAEKILEQLTELANKLLKEGICAHVIGIPMVHVAIDLAIGDGVSLENFHKYVEDVYKHRMAKAGNYEEEI